MLHERRNPGVDSRNRSKWESLLQQEFLGKRWRFLRWRRNPFPSSQKIAVLKFHTVRPGLQRDSFNPLHDSHVNKFEFPRSWPRPVRNYPYETPHTKCLPSCEAFPLVPPHAHICDRAACTATSRSLLYKPSCWIPKRNAGG